MGITEKSGGNVVGGIVAYLGNQKLSWGTTAPTAGIWKRGDVIFNAGATGSDTGGAGWICVSGSSGGGSWKAFGNIVS